MGIRQDMNVGSLCKEDQTLGGFTCLRYAFSKLSFTLSHNKPSTDLPTSLSLSHTQTRKWGTWLTAITAPEPLGQTTTIIQCPYKAQGHGICRPAHGVRPWGSVLAVLLLQNNSSYHKMDLGPCAGIPLGSARQSRTRIMLLSVTFGLWVIQIERDGDGETPGGDASGPGKSTHLWLGPQNMSA